MRAGLAGAEPGMGEKGGGVRSKGLLPHQTPSLLSLICLRRQ